MEEEENDQKHAPPLRAFLVTLVIIIGLTMYGLHLKEKHDIGIDFSRLTDEEEATQQQQNLGVSIFLVAGVLFAAMMLVYGFTQAAKKHAEERYR